MNVLKINPKNTVFAANYTLNCAGRLLDLSSPKVMGILNLTPDSFYDGGHFNQLEKAVRHCQKMINNGADIIEIGGMSSRPGASIISQQEEIKRIEKVVKTLVKQFPHCIFSIDTVYAETVRWAVDNGIHIVNDISGGQFDAEMLTTVAQLKCPYVLMHMRGTPETMQQQVSYNNIILDITDYFIERLQACKMAGITDVVIDPGIGFSKTITQNFTLLRRLRELSILECAVMVGVSRKSMIWKTLATRAEQALNGTTVLHTIALLNGAHILRTHDVKEAKEAIKLIAALKPQV